MKKIICLLLVCLLALAALASAETIEGTGLAFTLPSDYTQYSLTADDKSDGMVAYYYNDSVDLAIYADDSGWTVDEVLESYSEDSDMVEAGLISETIAGLRFGYSVFKVTDDGDTYYAVSYFTVSGDILVEFIFYMDSLDDMTESDSIVATISSGSAVNYSADTAYSGTAVAVGNTGLTFELPAGYEAEELTDDDIADDMTAYWSTDDLGIAVYEYYTDYVSIEDVKDAAADDSDISYSGLTQMAGGMQFAYLVMQESDYTDICYITILNGTTVQIDFLMYTDDASEASREAAQIINTIR